MSFTGSGTEAITKIEEESSWDHVSVRLSNCLRVILPNGVAVVNGRREKGRDQSEDNEGCEV